MRIEKLDHVNVRTTQLETMITWYTDVLGMRSGDRPNFPFPGAWMYTDSGPQVHLVGIEGPAATGSEVALKLEHFAFAATGSQEFEAHLEARGEQFRRSELPDFNLAQYNVWDPDGNHIHIDFALDE